MQDKISLTIKPTLSCNMRCRHCFNGNDLNTSSALDISTVCRMIEIAGKEYRKVRITFHGGEPTLAGMDYYKSIFKFQKQIESYNDTSFENVITTNGLLLNDKFIDLLVMNNVLINVSFDGPYNYILREHSDKVYENILKLQSRNAKLNIFCTISEESYTHITEIYKWFNERGLDFKILPIEKRGYARENQELIMNPAKFVKALADAYRFWIQDKNCRIHFLTFEDFAKLESDKQFKPYWFNRKLALNPDGRIYPFGRPNDIHYCLGRPEEINSFKECFEAEPYLELRGYLNKYYNKNCFVCRSKGVCNGVAVGMSYMYVDDDDLLKYSCNQSDMIFTEILRINETIKDDFRKGESGKYSEYINDLFSGYNAVK